MSHKISFVIYVLLQFLLHIIPIVLLSSVNQNQCTGWFFLFLSFHVHTHIIQIYTCTNYWNL